MIPRKINLQAGRTRIIDFSSVYDSTDWSDSDQQGEDVLAADVASATFLLKERLSLSDDDAEITKTLVSGITMIDGKASVTLSPDDTKDLQGTYYATLTFVLSNGEVLDWLDGDYEDVPYLQVDITQRAVEAVS